MITPYVGGGFGGKSAGRQADEAARLAKITGQPVQVAWTRAEEFFYDTFDPASVVKIGSAVDADGKITLWDYDVYFAGDRGAGALLRRPERPHAGLRRLVGRAERAPHRFGVGPWRAPGGEHERLRPRVADRRHGGGGGRRPARVPAAQHRRDARMRRVLEAGGDRLRLEAGRRPERPRQGRRVRRRRRAPTRRSWPQVRVDRASGAREGRARRLRPGHGDRRQPRRARRCRSKGCITMGLGYALSEELRFRGGEILDENFDTYELPRFSWLPRIETVLVKNDDAGAAGRRRAGDRAHGRRDRQRRLRRHRRARVPASDHSSPAARGHRRLTPPAGRHSSSRTGSEAGS